jgi:hypothetical protein
MLAGLSAHVAGKETISGAVHKLLRKSPSYNMSEIGIFLLIPSFCFVYLVEFNCQYVLRPNVFNG